MNVLFVADERPWPARSGYQLRIGQALEALASIASVDLAVAVGNRRVEPPVPAPAFIARETEVTFRGQPGGRLAIARRWPRSDLPRALLRRDWSPAAAELRSWLRQSYDLAWFSHLEPYLAFGSLLDLPTVVDLDNLHLARAEHTLPLQPSKATRSGERGNRIARRSGQIDLRRWQRLDRRTARDADAVLVCSESDREWLAVPSAVVVPNAYPAPADEPVALPSAPTMLLVATLAYQPNLDAAHAFVEHVLPLVRDRIPGAELRLVGKYTREPDVAWLRRQPGVTVVGEVAEVTAELAAARAVVVPIRAGGGTRIKILEAFAYSRPVVSTTIGAEGLPVSDGAHLLIADDSAGFAAACVRLLCDDDLCARLVNVARGLHADRYSGDRAREITVEVARRVAEPSAAPRSAVAR